MKTTIITTVILAVCVAAFTMKVTFACIISPQARVFLAALLPPISICLYIAINEWLDKRSNPYRDESKSLSQIIPDPKEIFIHQPGTTRTIDDELSDHQDALKRKYAIK